MCASTFIYNAEINGVHLKVLLREQHFKYIILMLLGCLE